MKNMNNKKQQQWKVVEKIQGTVESAFVSAHGSIYCKVLYKKQYYNYSIRNHGVINGKFIESSEIWYICIEDNDNKYGVIIPLSIPDQDYVQYVVSNLRKYHNVTIEKVRNNFQNKLRLIHGIN